MDTSSAMQDREACQRLITAFAVFVDSGQVEPAAALFAVDASFERRGERLEGQAAIRAALLKRSPLLVTRHLCAPAHVELTGPDQARGVTYFTLYRHERPADGPAGLAPLQAPELIGEYHDEFRRTADGWRIQARVARGVFRAAG